MKKIEMGGQTPEAKEKFKKGFFESKGEMGSDETAHFNNDVDLQEIKKVEREFVEWNKFESDVFEKPNQHISISEPIQIPIPEKDMELLKIPIEGKFFYSKSNHRESDNDPDGEGDPNDPEYNKEYVICNSEFPGKNHIWYYYRVKYAGVTKSGNELDVSMILKPLHDNGHAPIELRQKINLSELK